MEQQTHTVAAVVAKPKRAHKKFCVGFKGDRYGKKDASVFANSQASAKELFARAHGTWDTSRVEIL